MTASRRQSPVEKFAEWTLRHALRFWPTDSKEWGEAMAAELRNVQTSKEVLQWTFGGMLFFLRSVGSRILEWIQLPVGSSSAHGSSWNGGEPPRLPRHSRILTALLLVAAVCSWLPPWGREAIAGVVACWQLYADFPRKAGPIEEFADRAEREKDPQKLALASMIVYSDSSRRIELASEAVTLDPSLTWIYASHLTSFGPDLSREYRIQQLQRYDPDNGYVYLLAAEGSHHAKFEALIQKRSPSPREVETLLSSDPEGLALVERAVRSPKYDSYSHRCRALGREVWSRDRTLSPGLVLNAVWAGSLPDPRDLKTYVQLRVGDAQSAQTNGTSQQIAQAEQTLLDLNAFGQRMAGQEQTDFEQLIGLDTSHGSLAGLRALYLASKNTEREQEISAQLGQVDARRTLLMQSFKGLYETYEATYRRKAVILRVCLAILLLCAIAIPLSLLVLEVPGQFRRNADTRTRKAACFVVNYAPITLFLVSAAFLYNFRPFALAFADYRSGIGLSADPRFLAGALFSLQQTFFPHFPTNAASLGWWAATLLLAVLALLITVHGFVRRKPGQ